MMHHHRINDENAYYGHQQQQQQYMAQKSSATGLQQRSVFGDVTNNIQQKQYNQVSSKPVGRAPLTNMTNYQSQQVKPLSVQQQQQQQAHQQQIPSYRFSSGAYQQHIQQPSHNHVPSMSARSMNMSEDSPIKQDYLAKPEQFQRLPDVDHMQSSDPQYCSEYATEIYEHQKSIEKKFLAPADYMSQQPDLSDHMRSVLVDWLVEVHESFDLMPETLFLCINLIDRFLSMRQIPRTKLQLVGVSALLIASKYEEIHVPELDEFVGVAAHAYSREELIQMERVMLTTLDFNVTVSTPYPFLRRFLRCGKCSHRVHYLAYMLTELSLLVTDSLKYTPSLVACSSIYLAQKFFGAQVAWDRTLQQYSGYTESDLRGCAQLILGLVKMQIQEAQKPKEKRKLIALWRKYSAKARLKVAEVLLANLSN